MTKKAIPAVANFVKSFCIADIRIAKLAYSDILTNFHTVALVMGLFCRGSFFMSTDPPSNPFNPL